jgi:predicted nucleotidyltransferase
MKHAALKFKPHCDIVYLCTNTQRNGFWTMPDDQAFLSARVPVAVRNRFKTLAASKGLNVQELLRTIVGDYLRDQQVPEVAFVIKTLREHRHELEEVGVERLSLVGSVARGEAKPGSDIDFAFAFREGVKVGLFDYGKLQYTLEDMLPGFKIDVAPWKSLRPSVLEGMTRDAIEVL